MSRAKLLTDEDIELETRRRIINSDPGFSLKFPRGLDVTTESKPCPGYKETFWRAVDEAR